MSVQACPQTAECLFPGLHKLDILLGAAIRKAEQLYGQQASGDPYRGLYITEQEAQQLLGRDAGAPLFADPGRAVETSMGGRLDQLAKEFCLEPFDLDLIVVALAPELDLRYERLYAYLQDDVTRKRPGVDLALNLLCRSAVDKINRRKHLSPESPLRRNGMVHLIADPSQPAPPLLSCFLKLDDQVLKYVVGAGGVDARIIGFCRLVKPAVELNELLFADDVKTGLSVMVRDAVRNRSALSVYLEGAPGSGKRSLCEALSLQAQKQMLVADLSQPQSAEPGALELVFRDACFLDTVLYLDGVLNPGVLTPYIAQFPGIVFAGGCTGWSEQGRSDSHTITVRIDRPSYSMRRQLWQRCLTKQGWALNEAELTSLANRYLFTPRQIEKSAAHAARLRTLRAATGAEASPLIDDLISGARAEGRTSLGTLAVRVIPKATWSDIVLPRDQKIQLLEICNQAEFRFRVYGEWGFDQKLSNGKGLNVLFSGPPGTGKTMAAEVIAARLRLDLQKIDLSQVVSKYIGETEKNLSRVFQEARHSNCILFFDEADALCGRRSEVRDAHDRYANVEVAFLLQQMEDYDGVSILATNLKQNIDEAFLRRLAFTVEFPFPDEASRRAIWETAWPSAVPLSPDIDFAHLARTFRFSGGNIKNAVVAASFFGARRGSVGMTDLLMAARRESEKMGKSPARHDFGQWWDSMQERTQQDWMEAQAS
jgi:hypothetical protein